MPTSVSASQKFIQGRDGGRAAVQNSRGVGSVLKSLSTVWGFYVLSVVVVLGGVALALSGSSPMHMNRPSPDPVARAGDSIDPLIDSAFQATGERIDQLKDKAATVVEDVRAQVGESIGRVRQGTARQVADAGERLELLKEKAFEKVDDARNRAQQSNGQFRDHSGPNLNVDGEIDRDSVLFDKSRNDILRGSQEVLHGTEDIAHGVAEGVDAARIRAATAARDVQAGLFEKAQKVKESLKDNAQEINAAVRERVDHVKTVIKDNFDGVSASVHNAAHSAKETVNQAFKKGEAAVHNSQNRIEEVVTRGENFVAGQVDDAANKAHRAAEELRRQAEY
eukprot:ANDGO_05947.mRNA.1 hypothetical protein